jgi:hypothetical protein
MINELQQRLHKDRPMVTISLRMPEDVLHDLKRVAPLTGPLVISRLCVLILARDCELTWNDG